MIPQNKLAIIKRLDSKYNKISLQKFVKFSYQNVVKI